MQFESTRGKSADAGFEKVLLSALADDGGLFLPTDLPRLTSEESRELRGFGYGELAGRILPHLIGNQIEPDVLQEMIDAAYGSFRHRPWRPSNNWVASSG